MIKGEQRGFTVIEVVLFLGISALLLLVAFSFTSATLRNTRFTDTTKSFQGFVQEQYTRVQTNSLSLNTPAGRRPVCVQNGAVTGENTTNAAGTSSCMLLGAVLDFATGGTTVTITPLLGYTKADTQTFAGVNPQLWAEARETYPLAWQATIAKKVSVRMADIANVATNTDQSINRIIIARNIQSEAINFYTTSQSVALTTALDTAATSNIRNVPTLICIQSDDGGALRGAIQIKGTGTETSTTINAVTSSVVGQSELFFTTLGSGFGGVSC